MIVRQDRVKVRVGFFRGRGRLGNIMWCKLETGRTVGVPLQDSHCRPVEVRSMLAEPGVT